MKFKVFHTTRENAVSYIYDTPVNGQRIAENPFNLKELSVKDPSSFILEMEYTPVAIVLACDLDECYMLTNSIDFHWSENTHSVTTITLIPQRSTSIGDLIKNTRTNELFIVEACGFRKLGE